MSSAETSYEKAEASVNKADSTGIEDANVIIAESQVVSLVADLALKAPLASPTFTGTVTAPDVTMGEAKNIALGTTTGSKIGTATAQKLAFHNATPVVQRAGAAQAAVATTAATNSTPFGFAEAQANAIITLLNEIRAALVEKGIIKGAA